MISIGINFWPVTPNSDILGEILKTPDPSLSAFPLRTCWSTAGLTFTTESYITLQTFRTKYFPLLVNITLQNVVGCESGDEIALLSALMKSPNSLNNIGELETTPVLSIRSCSFISSKEENDVTTCVFNCRDEENEELSPNGVQGYALRLTTLRGLGASYGVCYITGWNYIPQYTQYFAAWTEPWPMT